MKNLVFFVEGRSEKEMLKGILPKLLSQNIKPFYIVFEGKQDMENKFTKRLNGWQKPNSVFVILLDQDQEDCKLIKKRIVKKCQQSQHKRGRQQLKYMVRIACRELESWYLGDINAVAKAFNKPKLPLRYQNKQQYKNPDKIQNPSKLLIKITNGEYQKISGAKIISPYLSLWTNKSNSFKVFIKGIKKLEQ